jgi:hypothetical protein
LWPWKRGRCKVISLQRRHKLKHSCADPLASVVRCRFVLPGSHVSIDTLRQNIPHAYFAPHQDSVSFIRTDCAQRNACREHRAFCSIEGQRTCSVMSRMPSGHGRRPLAQASQSIWGLQSSSISPVTNRRGTVSCCNSSCSHRAYADHQHLVHRLTLQALCP